MRVLTNLSVSGTTTTSDATALTHAPTNRQLPGALGYGAVEFYGHSMTSFGGSLTSARGLASRLGSMLHADVRDFTINGAQHANHDIGTPFLGTYSGDGGWAHVYTFASPEAHAAPYEPRRDAAVLFTGVNDVAAMGTTNMPTPFKNAMRSSISRLRAASVFENSDASVAYSTGGSHTWGSNAGGTFPVVFTSGTTYHKTTGTAVSSTVTISVPSDFPGGTVAFASLCGPAGQGGTFSFTVDGGASGTLVAEGVQPKNVTTNTNRNMWTPVIKRFTGLSSGAHTIVATVTSVTTEAYFDCWWIEAASPPLINVPTAPYTDGGLGHPVNTDIDAVNTHIATVVGEFDANVFSTDLNALLNQTTDLFDGEHLNDQGMKKAASKYAEDFLVRSRTLLQHAEGNSDQHFLTRFPAQTWDTSTPLNNQVNVIQATRPNVVPLTIRQTQYGSPASESTKIDLFRIEDKAGAIISGVDYQGRIYTGTGTGQASLLSVVGVPVMFVGSANIVGGAGTMVIEGGSTSSAQVQITSPGAATADLLQLANNGTNKALVTKDGDFVSAASGIGVHQFEARTAITDTKPIFGITGGAIVFGPGGSSATDLTVYRSASGVLDMRSGAIGTKQSIVQGRTSDEVESGISGATNDILTGSAAGDLVTNLADSSKSVRVGINNTLIAVTTSLGFSVTGITSSSGGFSAGSSKVINVANGTATNDAVNFGQLNPNLGTWFAIPNLGNNLGAALTAGTLYYGQIIVPVNATLTGVSFNCSTTASGSAKALLFNSAGTKLKDGTGLTLATGFNKALFASGAQSATPGVYFIALIFSAASTISCTSALSPSGTSASGTYASPPASITVPTVAGAFVPSMTTV